MPSTQDYDVPVASDEARHSQALCQATELFLEIFRLNGPSFSMIFDNLNHDIHNDNTKGHYCNGHD